MRVDCCIIYRRNEGVNDDDTIVKILKDKTTLLATRSHLFLVDQSSPTKMSRALLQRCHEETKKRFSSNSILLTGGWIFVVYINVMRE